MNTNIFKVLIGSLRHIPRMVREVFLVRTNDLSGQERADVARAFQKHEEELEEIHKKGAADMKKAVHALRKVSNKKLEEKERKEELQNLPSFDT